MGVPNSRGCQIPYDTGTLILKILVSRTEIFSKISVTGSGERETELDALNKETPDWKE